MVGRLSSQAVPHETSTSAHHLDFVSVPSPNFRLTVQRIPRNPQQRRFSLEEAPAGGSSTQKKQQKLSSCKMIARHLFRGSGIVRLSDQAPRTAVVPLLASARSNGSKSRGNVSLGSNWRTLSQSVRNNRPYHQDSDERLRSARPLVPNALASKFTNTGTGRNSRTLVVVTVAAAIAFYMYNSQTVPVTGRRRFNFLSDTLVAQAYVRAAEAIVRQVEEQGGHFLSDWDPRTILVKRVMKRLIPVSGMEDLDWEVRVIADSRTANAFVIPGGKVFVHSGILNVCRSEDALAAVLGHEIAHNTASHAAERLSAAWVGNLTAGSLFFLAGALPGLALFGLWNVIGGYYLQDLLFYLPMGRKQESEADYIGLMMMAEACYDPRQAVGFWQRMETIQRLGGNDVPEMLSTHPSNEHRITKIEQWLPEAMKKRMESDCKATSAFADRFREALRKRRSVVIEL